MHDDQLRALVRDAVRRHVSPAVPEPLAPTRPARVASTLSPAPTAVAPATMHLSHAMYLTLVNPGEACLIEPAVACNHCGYCQCHGH